MGWLRQAYWGLAAGGGVYMLLLLALTNPVVQRNATYAYRANPTVFQDLSNVDQFGFFHHQVQPFTVTTPDNVTLFAWHILPTHLYRQHAPDLKAQSDFGLKPFQQAITDLNLRLLFDDEDAQVVVYFHGNAGHLASAYRPATFQQILGASTTNKPVHVIAFDYRGFGLSTGTPDEDGVIQDGISVLSLLTGYDSPDTTSSAPAQETLRHVLKPSQIILFGQSMGTFVSTAVFHHWTLLLKRPSFKALMLFASFGNLTQLLEGYSIKGITPPMLAPLRGYPWLHKWFLSKIVDKWETDRRLRELVLAPDIPLDLTIMHAHDDWEIPWIHGMANWNVIKQATTGTTQANDPNLKAASWTSHDYLKDLKWEKIRHGGHNRVQTSEQAKAALMDVLERE